MNKKMILGLVAVLTSLDAFASENNKLKMGLIGGATLVIGAAASYKIWENHRAQSAVAATPDEHTVTAEKAAQGNDTMWYEELSVGTRAAAATGNDDQVSSALDSVRELLINISDTQKNHEERLAALELRNNRVEASVQSSPVGQIDETSSWNGNMLSKVSSHDSFSGIVIPEENSTQNHRNFSGIDQSIFDSHI